MHVTLNGNFLNECVLLQKKLDLLKQSDEIDTGRDLLMLFDECQWRAIKIDILNELRRFPQPRVLEFLFRIALDQSDLPLCHGAVQALGRSGSPMAARFLVQFFSYCLETVKPFVISALGQLQDRTLASELMALLPTALKDKQSLLVRNTVLTLAALKVTKVVPYLQELALTGRESQECLSALLALGKISRDTSWFCANEKFFVDVMGIFVRRPNHACETSEEAQMQGGGRTGPERTSCT